MMDDIRTRVEHYQTRAHRKGRAHYLASKKASRNHIKLGVPVVVLSTVVGSAVFASIEKGPDIQWQILTGLLSLAAAVLATLQTFFKFSEIAEKHLTSASNYASLKRRFDTFLLKVTDTSRDRDEVLDALESIVSELDTLEKESLDVPDKLYDRAVSEQINDQEGI